MKPFLGYGWQPQIMAVEGRLKAILANKTEVYDVIADPAEEKNLGAGANLSPALRKALDDYPVPSPEAARAVLELCPDILDINMGCSVRCVAGRGAGAGLLRDPRKVGRIISSLSRALPIPVTAKIRLGWDAGSRNFLEVARAVADGGGALIAVHARTREQAYGGHADWDAIAAVKASVAIPVIGNGDVLRVEDIQRLRDHTGCDGVMIGRGAIGNPWIFQRRDRRLVPPGEIVATIRRHAKHMTAYYGEREGLVLFRKHLTRYLLPLQAPEETRVGLLSATALQDFEGHLQALLRGPVPAAAD
jgi:nifR3 family TIM-barrel protein